MKSSTLLVVVTALVVSLACGAETATEQADPESLGTSGSALDTPASKSNKETPEDQTIRRSLTEALKSDADLRNRAISFTVANGDINVRGTVQNEAERKRINDLAMAIPGVKSIANGLQVLE